MTIRKYKVMGVQQKNPNVADSVARLHVRLVEDIYIKFNSPEREQYIPAYERLQGFNVLIDVREGDMNKEDWTAFKGDGKPTPDISVDEFLSNKSPIYSSSVDGKQVDTSTGEVMPMDKLSSTGSNLPPLKKTG